MVVKNLNGHAIPPCGCGSWLSHWRRCGKPSEAFSRRQSCSVVVCNNPIEQGGMVQKEVLEGMRALGMVGDSTPSTSIGAAQAASTGLIGAMPEGGAETIASRGQGSEDDLLDYAAMEAGTD